jgi:hypothetical protein
MPVQSLSADDLKALVAAELRQQHALDDVDSKEVVILPRERGWWAALRRDGGLIDEARCAAVAEVSQRLSRGFALAPGGA